MTGLEYKEPITFSLPHLYQQFNGIQAIDCKLCTKILAKYGFTEFSSLK